MLVFGEIDDKLARATCERLIALPAESDAPIHMPSQAPPRLPALDEGAMLAA